LLLCPPAIDAMDLIDFVLPGGWGCSVWVKAFFDPSRAGPHQLGAVVPSTFTFLARQFADISMTFTYDTKLNF
jgi:hypothetical protein